MAEADTELISPHIHIKNASMCGKVLTENQLETGKRSPIYPSCKKDLHVTRVGWEKIKMELVALGGICEEEKVHMGGPSL